MARPGPALAMVLVAVAALGWGGQTSARAATATTATSTTRGAPGGGARAPQGLDVSVAPWRLGAPVSREIVLNDGKKVLVYGGQDASHDSIATAAAIDPSTGVASSLGSLAPAVHDAAGVRVGHRSLIIAGGSPPPRAVVQRLRGTDPAQSVGQLPAPRTDHVAATIGKAIYVLGGAQDEGLPIASVVASTDGGASWHDAGALDQPARYPGIAVVHDAVYVFGGVTSANGSDTTAIQRYDPKTQVTTVVAQLPAPVSHATAVVFRGVVFLLGGYVDNVPSNQILRYDPHTEAVTRVGTLPSPLTDAAATVIADVGYLVGGERPGRTTTADVELLRPR
ncbi:MAG TPA: hypothetical protein VFW97_03910 [Acidimicrobiia bacterium]|nr:hypothetical protein [Acidimicrobiia bacterium]